MLAAASATTTQRLLLLRAPFSQLQLHPRQRRRALPLWVVGAPQQNQQQQRQRRLFSTITGSTPTVVDIMSDDEHDNEDPNPAGNGKIGSSSSLHQWPIIVQQRNDHHPSSEQAQPQQQQQHPLLERHYSTIGIGDVFVNAEGPAAAASSSSSDSNLTSVVGWTSVTGTGDKNSHWWLPQSYLRNAITHKESWFQDTKDKKAGTAAVLLWEMMGTLKTEPEDFVVRERAYVGANGIGRAAAAVTDEAASSSFLEVADLQLKLRQVPTTRTTILQEEENDDSPSHKKMAATSATSMDQAASASGTGGGGGGASPESMENKCAAGGDGGGTVCDAPCDDPKHNLGLNLVKYLTPEVAAQKIEAMEHLNAQAMEKIQALVAVATLPGSDTIDNNTNIRQPEDETNIEESVLLSLALDTDKDTKDQKSERTELFLALKYAFPLLKASGDALSSTNSADDDKPYIIRMRVDDFFFPLIPYLHAPEQDLPPLYEYTKRGWQPPTRSESGVTRHRKNRSSRHSSSSGPLLRLKPNLPREQRRPVHNFIELKTKNALGTMTIANVPLSEHDESNTTTTAIQVSWSKTTERRVLHKRKRENNIATEYQLCVVKKHNCEHFVMVQILREGLTCRGADIGLAGIKDKHAVTYQFVTLCRMGPSRIRRSEDFFSRRGLVVQPLCQVSRPLQVGELVGNRFEIVVRDLRRVQLVLDGNGSVREDFVPVDEAHVRNMMERLRTGGFVNFYGEQRVGEPGPSTLTGVRAFDVGRAMLQQRWWDAVDLIMTGRRLVNGVEMEEENLHPFRRVWKETGGDVEATCKALFGERHFVPNERVILKGLKRYGKDNPLAVLQCLSHNDRIFYINAYEAYLFNKLATERMRLYGTNVVAGDLIQLDGSNEVVVVDEALSTNASFENVVLPMLGYDSLIPANEVGRYCEALLKEENVRFDKDAPEEATIRGSYRRILAKADNISYEMIPDEDDTVHAKFSFDLPAGTYATMFFRELMLTTVARTR